MKVWSLSQTGSKIVSLGAYEKSEYLQHIFSCSYVCWARLQIQLSSVQETAGCFSSWSDQSSAKFGPPDFRPFVKELILYMLGYTHSSSFHLLIGHVVHVEVSFYIVLPATSWRNEKKAFFLNVGDMGWFSNWELLFIMILTRKNPGYNSQFTQANRILIYMIFICLTMGPNLLNQILSLCFPLYHLPSLFPLHFFSFSSSFFLSLLFPRPLPILLSPFSFSIVNREYWVLFHLKAAYYMPFNQQKKGSLLHFLSTWMESLQSEMPSPLLCLMKFHQNEILILQEYWMMVGIHLHFQN